MTSQEGSGPGHMQRAQKGVARTACELKLPPGQCFLSWARAASVLRPFRGDPHPHHHSMILRHTEGKHSKGESEVTFTTSSILAKFSPNQEQAMST